MIDIFGKRIQAVNDLSGLLRQSAWLGAATGFGIGLIAAETLFARARPDLKILVVGAATALLAALSPSIDYLLFATPVKRAQTIERMRRRGISIPTPKVHHG